MLIAIFLNGLNPFEHFDIIIGFFFLAITGNTWNDVVDMKDPEEIETLERVEGYNPKEIFVIGFTSLLLGLTLLMRTCIENPINFLLLMIIIVMVLLYIKWFKPLPVINHVLLGGSHILLPYFMIKIDAGLGLISRDVEVPLMLAFFAFALTGQLVHEVIDGDAMRKRLSLKNCQRIIWAFSIVTIILAIWAFFIYPGQYNYYFAPFLFFPMGTIYTFRHPTISTRGVKDVGILIGNFLLLYFVCLIALQMAGTI